MSKKIRAAMVILEYAPVLGGAQRQLALLAPHLQALDVEIFVLTRQFSGLAPFETVDGVPVWRLQAPGPKALASLVYSAASLRQLARIKPDLVHAYSLFSPLTTAVVYKALTGTPVAVKILRGGQLGDLYRLDHKPLGRQRLGFFRRSVDAFISISQEISAELVQAQVEERRRPYIPNGVDTDHFSPVDSKARQEIRTSLGLTEGPLVVYTGRLVPEKQVDLLLQAWPSVLQRHPAATLLIVGSGASLEPLRRQAPAQVLFSGGVADVLPYLHSADLFILPSSHEGLSNALLEAMSAGLAVVATRVGGAPDLVEHGVSGWLIPSGDVSAIRDSLTTLLDNPGTRDAMGVAARQVVVERYSLPVVAGKLRGLYEALLT
jgi:glycosyltransferase involved in cell wall biosynthesis